MHTFFLIYLLSINMFSFFIWGRDKRKAKNHTRRISEKQLLRCVLLGGGGGALAGQHLFRHKTIKGKFLRKFYLALLVWFGVFVYLLYESS